MNTQFQGNELGLVTMLQHAAAWNKMQTNLTLDEAVKVSVAGLLSDAYVLADSVRRLTRGYHHEDVGRLKELYQGIVKRGFDVVDDCEEKIYRCVKNIEEEGDDPVMVSYAKEDIKNHGKGILAQLGLDSNGVLSLNPYGGMAQFQTLLQRHNLI